MLNALYQSIASVSAPLAELAHVPSTRALAGTAVIACALGCAVYSPVAEASTETVLYSFCSQANCSDGSRPYGGLINVGGTLYGAVEEGGANDSGVAFSFNPQTGAETVLYSFCSQANCTDGSGPGYMDLLDVRGTLYGTTQSGGSDTGNCAGGGGCGTVFSLNPATGAETVLHSFGIGTDGRYPQSALIKVSGTLYGTTYGGGADSNGTIFSLDKKSGAETGLYSFGSQTNDGNAPYASLTNVDGTLYGVTSGGGANGCGILFSANPQTLAETILYSFGSSGSDACFPAYGGLINVKGMLYGTTGAGGAYGDGTVYSFNPQTLTETVLYSFGNGTDGQDPAAGVIKVGHVLYGTTQLGGTSDAGTVFSLNLRNGHESVLHSFSYSGTDGYGPVGRLINVGGTLYGLTPNGGTNQDGIVFSIVP